jgi:hypothetical protein
MDSAELIRKTGKSKIITYYIVLISIEILLSYCVAGLYAALPGREGGSLPSPFLSVSRRGIVRKFRISSLLPYAL